MLALTESATVWPTAPVARRPSRLRAWWYLLRFCLQRQARTGQMVWIALALLALTLTIVELQAQAGRWSMEQWRSPRGFGPSYREWLDVATMIPQMPPGSNYGTAFLAASRAVLSESGFLVFANWVAFAVVVGFLLPIWTLSFATNALGSESEARTLGWLLMSPLSRASLYLAKFLAILPYAFGLTVGGYFLLCLAAGTPGHLAWRLFWPAVAWGTLAFCSLFHLMGACFRRPSVVAIVYSFFLESFVGSLPGFLKRMSISFYVRCLMYEAAEGHGIQPEKASVYMPVSGRTAEWVLLGVTVCCFAVGIVVFSRREYVDVA